MRKRKIVLLTVMGIIIVFALYVMISLWISTNYLLVREYEVDTGKAAEPIQAVVISDLHDHEFGEENIKLVEKIEAVKPDLILMDGDMLNSDSSSASIPVKLIQNLKKIAPVYYALGNHEEAYIENGHAELIEELEAAGAVVLDKEYVDIEINGTQVRLGGMYDYAFGLDGNNTALSVPEGTLNFLMDYQNTDRLKIMMAHRPDSFVFGDASSTWNIDLVISGHNHGGQIVLPLLGGLYGGDQGWFPEYIHGIYQKDNIQMFVTSGLGSNQEKLPRFNNPPEIALLTIK